MPIAHSYECYLLCTQAEITDFLPYKAESAQPAFHATIPLHLDSAMLSHAHDAFGYLIEDGGLLGALSSVRGFEDINFLDFVVHEPHVTVVTNSTTTITKET